ncbi:MAG: glycine betaine ABC transporter substrate-binding protein [Clostridium sp.]
MGNFIEFIFSQKEQILKLTIQHMTLTIIAISIAIIIGIPLGIFISRIQLLKKPIVGSINLVQAIPSMALLGILIPFLGIGSTPAICMVVMYSLLPIVKNTCTGISGIDPVVLESAKGIGLTKNQVLFKIQLPLALPMIMSGVRISAVTSVGLMTLAAFIGAGGLGYLVFSGVQTINNNMILAGAIPACILALLVDYIFGKIELLVTPKGLNPSSPRSNFLGLKVISTVLAVLFSISIINSVINNSKDSVTIGSKNFTEQLILGNIFALMVEEHTNYSVNKKFNLGGSSIAFAALESGEIDLYPDYTGTILLNIMNQKPINDSKKSYDHINEFLNTNHNLMLLEPLGFNNTYNLTVTKDFANKYNLNTISDLAKISSYLTLTPTLEFENRSDGLKGLSKHYNLKFNKVKAMDGSLRYSALSLSECDVIDAFTTDGLLKKFDLKILEDDKNFFSPYDTVPVVNKASLEKYPELEKTLNLLKGRITKEKMIDLNYQVDEEGKNPEEVAKSFLLKENLIS